MQCIESESEVQFTESLRKRVIFNLQKFYKLVQNRVSPNFPDFILQAMKLQKLKVVTLFGIYPLNIGFLA